MFWELLGDNVQVGPASATNVQVCFFHGINGIYEHQGADDGCSSTTYTYTDIHRHIYTHLYIIYIHHGSYGPQMMRVRRLPVQVVATSGCVNVDLSLVILPTGELGL